MTRRLDFLPEARADLRRLSVYITERSGAARAAAYMARIEARCAGLVDFPMRGAKRGDLRPGLRTVGFERRITIAFVAEPEAVTIVRVLYGGRDLEAALDDE